MRINILPSKQRFLAWLVKQPSESIVCDRTNPAVMFASELIDCLDYKSTVWIEGGSIVIKQPMSQWMIDLLKKLRDNPGTGATDFQQRAVTAAEVQDAWEKPKKSFRRTS